MAKTSCMNPEDGELVGMIELMILKAKDPVRKERLERLSQQFQLIGMSKWFKGEVTHLALRLGHRDRKKIDFASDVDLELDDNSDSDKE